jgi:hypothetical protein
MPRSSKRRATTGKSGQPEKKDAVETDNSDDEADATHGNGNSATGVSTGVSDAAMPDAGTATAGGGGGGGATTGAAAAGGVATTTTTPSATATAANNAISGQPAPSHGVPGTAVDPAAKAAAVAGAAVITGAAVQAAAAAHALAQSPGTTMGRLSLHLIASIFKFVDSKTALTVVPTVCTEWRRICKQHFSPAMDFGFAIKTDELDVKTSPLTDLVLGTMLNRFAGATSLTINHAGLVTDAGLREVVAKCPMLVSLDLSGCTQVSDAGVELIAARCPSLVCFNLSQCERITSVGIEKLALHCMQLTRLSLAQCWHVTDHGLQLLGTHLPGLLHLDVGFCDQISDKGLGELKG